MLLGRHTIIITGLDEMKETTLLKVSDRSQRLTARRAVKRSATNNTNQENVTVKATKKRSVSDISPNNPVITRKRTAFGDLTNAIQSHTNRMVLARKKATIKKTDKKETISIAKSRGRRSLTNKTKQPKKPNTSQSTNDETSEALTNIFKTDLISSINDNPPHCSTTNQTDFQNSLNDSNVSMKSELNNSKSRPVPELPLSVIESSINQAKEKPANLKPYDTDSDPFVVSEYAECVFTNMRKRELRFPVTNYLVKPFTETTGPMRAILIDWLVEVQENFELYHETLYLAVRITDNYLQNHSTPKEQLQLIGATALLIACKIEERHPPPLDDFQFICDDAYTHKQFVQMELRILQALDFDINIPHPYRYLRRYARVTSLSMQTLTLSRYILELSLQEAQFVDKLPSKMAAACLCLALKMKGECDWDVNLTYHTGYEEEELTDIMIALNSMVGEASQNKLQTVRTKYSHTIFYEVAKIPPVDPLLL